MYSTTSETTRNFCRDKGFNFEINFVETMVRNEKVYVRGTVGKPDEFIALKNACDGEFYIYTGGNK